MRVFFDNCTSHVLADTLNGYLRHLQHSAHHIRDLPCGSSAPDLEWIAMLAGSGEEWIVITGDGRIRRNKAERAAFQQASLKGFVLAPSYQKTRMHEVASTLVWHGPGMENLIRLVQGAALFELPISRTPRFRSLPL